jgi:ADP-heptose:LPS heptosyltransferase
VAIERLTGVRRIAVLKAGGLGDIVFTLPALEALRAAYPDAEIMLITGAAGVELFTGRPGPVDRLVVAPPFEGEEAASPEWVARADAFAEALRGEDGIDLAVQLHGGGRYSNPFVLRLGARESIGLQDTGAEPLDRTIPYAYFRHEVLRALEVVSLAGARPVELEPRLSVTPEDVAAADAVFPPDPRPLAVLHVGAGDRRRRWIPEGFAAVARALGTAGARVAVTGMGDEADAALAVCAHAPAAADLADALSLPALLGLLSTASVVVASDSGPLNLARAVGAATVGIYWCGNLVNAGPLTTLRHRTHESWRLACPVCLADCMADGCAHDASFVADVPAEPVAADALRLLAAEGCRARPVTAVGGSATTELRRAPSTASHPL